MKVCPNCQAENVDATRFCTQCGNSIENTITTAPEHQVPPATASHQPSQHSVPNQQTGSYPPIVQATNNKALWSLIIGIIGMFLFPAVFNVAAIILGYMAKNEISRSGGRQSGQGMALAGIILGWVGLFLGIFWVILAISLTSDASMLACLIA